MKKSILAIFMALIASPSMVLSGVAIIPTNNSTMGFLTLTPMCDIYVVSEGDEPVALSFLNIEQTGDILDDAGATGFYYFREYFVDPKTKQEVLGPISHEYRYLSEVRDQIELTTVATQTGVRKFRMYFALREGFTATTFQISITPVIGSTAGTSVTLPAKDIDYELWRDIAVINRNPVDFVQNRVVGVNVIATFEFSYFTSDFFTLGQYGNVPMIPIRIYIGKAPGSKSSAKAMWFYLRGPDYNPKDKKPKQLKVLGIRRTDFHGDYYAVTFFNVNKILIPAFDFNTGTGGATFTLLASVGKDHANGGTLTPMIVTEDFGVMTSKEGIEFVSGGIALYKLDTTKYYSHKRNLPKVLSPMFIPEPPPSLPELPTLYQGVFTPEAFLVPQL